MPDIEDMTPGEVLADASVAEFIKALGLSIAEAQKALDENSVDQMGEFLAPRDNLGGKSLYEMGLMPAFYHYQYADIACSLQLSLRVAKDLSLGVHLDGSYSSTSTENEESNESSSSTESGSSTATRTRSAQISISNTSTGALTVGGENYQLAGTTARERVEALSDTLRGRSDISRAIPQSQCTPIDPVPTTTAPADKVICTANDVAFVGAGFDRGLIRIRANPDADETYVLNNATSVTVSRSNSLANYAAKVRDAIQGARFNTRLIAPGMPMHSVYFDVDKEFIRPAHDSSLLNFAGYMRARNRPVKVRGYASRTGSDPYNQRLSERRAEAVRARLVANGAPAGNITVEALGESEWRAMNVPDETEMQAHRVVHLIVDGPDYYIWVDGDASHQMSNVSPDQRAGDQGNGNGFVYLYEAVGLSDVAGKKVTIKSVDFTLRGAAVGGAAAESAEAFALNLANDVNAHASVRVQASASGNVTHLCNEGDSFTLVLITSSSSNIALSGSEGITVTQEFSRSSSASMVQQNTGNRTIAVGASLDVRYGKQFETNITGNSTISARLVSIPAPPQFLETVKEFLAQSGG
ncbi:outer membrane protein OmpA-like peptidoglycan-associated protein [Rhodobacter sp. JA431]|uniref:OmpA family protein n=1 Tax=Rhodobacter sp. JA431 TaxID=570013 RepID=UPI000BCD695D|nr:OmpA family protein [Rhodobacter sp. JA431]SOB90030.1 outer membrane protein OmpA-like peptidoglycan-associated protein [Rhodobacter sp. JA431]